MEDFSLFDRLVRELDSDERRALLVRMQGALPSYPKELVPDPDLEAFLPEAELRRLGLLRRLLLLLTALLSGKDRAYLLRELYLRRVAERIRRENPGLIDFRASRFLPGMLSELTQLGDCARMLRGLLEVALGAERRAFIAFLARDELRDFQRRVLRDTDPEAIRAALQGDGAVPAAGARDSDSGQSPADDRALRVEMLRRFDRLTGSIPEDSKRRLYRDSGSLYGLRSFASFDFSRVITAFRQDKAATRSCPVSGLSELLGPLRALAESLSLVDRPPSPQALHDLVLFARRERLEGADAELERELTEELSRARRALAGIRGFHQRVPLTAILRWITRDPYYLPRVAGGGEDWLLLYQEFWRRRALERYLEYQRGRLRERLRERCRELLGVRGLPDPAHYRDGRFGSDAPVRHSLSVAFLQQFSALLFTDLERPLRLIYLNGEFFKEDNRRAFTDAVHFFDRLQTGMQALEQRLGPGGDLRAAIQVLKDAGQPPRAAGVREVLARADTDARALVEEALTRFENLARLLRGILEGTPGERYDSLANRDRLGGRENRQLAAAWARGMDLFERAHRLLQEVLALELA